MHLLVVDDDQTVRDSLSDALASAGVRVSTAASGRDALSLVAADPVDVVLTDVRMPGMGGLELLRLIRARSPGVDVVLMTAYDDASLPGAATREGARAYLAKPLDLPELRSLIVRLFRERGEGRAPAGSFP